MPATVLYIFFVGLAVRLRQYSREIIQYTCSICIYSSFNDFNLAKDSIFKIPIYLCKSDERNGSQSMSITKMVSSSMSILPS